MADQVYRATIDVNKTGTGATDAAADVARLNRELDALAQNRAGMPQGEFARQNADIQQQISLLQGVGQASAVVATGLGEIPLVIERSTVAWANLGTQVRSSMTAMNQYITASQQSSVPTGVTAEGILSPAAIVAATKYFQSIQGDASKAATGIKTAFDAAVLSPTAIAAVASRLDVLQSRASVAARGIGTVFDSAILSPTAISRAAAGFARLQSEGARAAHGVGVAFEAAVLSPTAIRAAQSSVSGLTRSLKEAEDAAFNWGQVGRHAVAIFDEAARGQRGAMVSSLSAMLRDSGMMAAAISRLSAPWGLVAAAGVGALAAIGYAAEQAYQRMSSLRETAASLALQGFGTSPGQQTDLAATFDRNRQATNEYAGSQRDLEQELNKLPAAAQPIRQQFEEVAKALSGLQRIDPAKAIEEAVKAAQHGGAAFADYITKIRGLENVTDSSGRSLKELAQSALTDEEAFRRLVPLLLSLDLKKIGTESREAANNLTSMAVAAGIGGEFGPSTLAMEAFGEAAQKAINPLEGVTVETTRLTEAVQQQNAAMIIGNATLDKRERLMNELAAAQRGIGDIYNVEQIPPSDQGQRENALANLAAQARKSALQPAEEEDHQRILAHIHEQSEARRADLQAQLKAAQDEESEARRIAAIRADAATRAAQQGGGTFDRQAFLDADVEIQKSHEKTVEAGRRLDDQAHVLKIDQLRAQAAEEQRGTQARLNDQLGIIALYQQEVEAGRKTPVELAQEWVKYGGMVRQLHRADYEAFKEAALEKIKDANVTAAEIIKTYQEIADAARRLLGDAAPREISSLAIAETGKIKQEQQKQFSAVEENISAQNRLGQMQIGIYKAQQDAQAAAHLQSKSTALVAEQSFTAQVMSQEEQRTAAALNADNLTDANKQKLYEQLAGLYLKDAETQAQYQKQITTAIETENAKRAKLFVDFATSAGDAIEKFITAGVTRSATFKDAASTLVQSLLGDVTKGITGLASRQLGSMLAGATGVKAGENAGLGEVIGLSISKALGMYKEPPATAQEAIKAAADKAEISRKAANDLLQKIVENTTPGKDAATVTGRPLGGGGVVGKNGYTTDEALDLIPKYESSGGQNIKNPKSSASGPWQFLDSTWRGYPESQGYAHAMDAPISLQRQVAAQEYEKGDFSAWAPYNPKLAAAIGRGEGRGGGGDDSSTGQSTQQLKSSVDQLAAKTTTATAAQQRGSDVLQQSTTADLNLNQTTVLSKQSDDQLKTTTDQQRQATVALTDTMKQCKEGGSAAAGGTTGTTPAATATSSLTTLTRGLGIAASAASLFGSNLSTGARVALGAVSVISQLASFGKDLGGVFDFLGITTKAVTAVTAVEQTAKTVNTTAFAADTVAVQTNAAAQTAGAAAAAAGGAASGAGGLLGGIGTIFKAIPIIGMLFEQGGIVPSAAGGMVSDGKGGQLAVLHPREMVLPAAISDRLQTALAAPGSFGGGGGTNTTFNYQPNIEGYHPFRTAGDFENLLRTNASYLKHFVRNASRNGVRF